MTRVSISADGKMLVEVRSNGGQESVWIRNIATGKDVQILPAVSLEYGSLEFSHDGNEIYFVRNDRAGSVTFNLYSVSILGGEPQLVFPHVSLDIALSPDGLNVAYRDSSGDSEEMHVVMLREGKNEIVAKSGSGFLSPPAWSPDGHMLAWASPGEELKDSKAKTALPTAIAVLDLRSKKQRVIWPPEDVTINLKSALDAPFRKAAAASCSRDSI